MARGSEASIAFMPARVLMQDFTGVPAVVDLAALRSAVARSGGDPKRVNPFIPVDLIIDHSVQVDRFGGRRCLRQQSGVGIPPQPRTLRIAQLGAASIRGLPRRTPGWESAIKSTSSTWDRSYHRATVGLSRHLGRNGLAHTDDQRPRRAGLGSRRHRGRGSNAGPADVSAEPIVVGVRTEGTLPIGTTATDLVLTLTQMLGHTALSASSSNSSARD